MAELSLIQIKQNLIDIFNKPDINKKRKIVFWYDPDGEFEEDINDFELPGVKILYLNKNNQFETKIVLERRDPDSNYLIYAPFSKPKPEDNHLEDTYLYSTKFKADRTSLLLEELGIDERFRPTLDKYKKFFRSKGNTEKFLRQELVKPDERAIEKGIICTLIEEDKSFNDALVKLVISPKEKQDMILAKMERYDILEPFWKYVKTELGYSDSNPDLKSLITSLYFSVIKNELNKYNPGIAGNAEQAEYFGDSVFRLFGYPEAKSGDARIFLDSIRNNVNYQEQYDRISREAAERLNLTTTLKSLPKESYYKIDVVPQIDDFLIKWITERLEQEDITAKISGESISEIIRNRMATYYGKKNWTTYKLLEKAVNLINLCLNFNTDFDNLQQAFEEYSESIYKIDQFYRKFYYYFDKLSDKEPFEKLSETIEYLYNKYLETEIRDWNKLLEQEKSFYSIKKLQRDLYKTSINPNNQKSIKTAVIISDALRYEIGQELLENLLKDKDSKYTGEIQAVAGMLPTYTRLAMSALLPHETLKLNEDLDVLVDNRTAYSIRDRDEILKKVNNSNVALRFDDLKNQKIMDLRQELNGKNLIYIYHNQIDARGDKPETEDEVFSASREAIDEIMRLIKRLSSANVYNFIITADHGFLYTRDKKKESDKIPLDDKEYIEKNKRYIISEEPLDMLGVISIPVKDTFNNDDNRYLNFPLTQRIFKAPGSGINYVHGGSSPQESIIPFITLRNLKSKINQREAGIQLLSQNRVIINQTVNFYFKQAELVSNEIFPQTYKVYLYSPNDERIISDTQPFIANAETSEESREKKISLELADLKYNREKEYYLIVENESGNHILKEPVIIDLPFSDDSFG